MVKATYTKEQLDSKLRIAEDDLDDAIHAITNCLDFEFENEFMPEFEALNAAHIRLKAARQRVRLADKVACSESPINT